MLSYCRPNGSRTESKFINKYIRPVGITYDKRGNMYKKIGDSPVMWSCHTDTVHSKQGFQKIEYWVNAKSGDTFLGVAQGDKSSCLGADDTTGIWLMLEMIKRNVPGLYIFHRAEEVGGLGSKWIAANNAAVFKDIKFAIAFDRKDTESIITYQRGTRCCSDEFAKSLAAELGMKHKCDEGGSFTDTASYVDLIAECTNVSTGYYNAHCASEHTNIDYLFQLRDALCKIDVTKLVEKRKPGENTRKWENYTYKNNNSSRWSDNYDMWRDYYMEDCPKGGKTFDELTALYPKSGWSDHYVYDTVSGFWIPRPNTKKDLGVTKLAPARSVTDDKGTRYSSYNDAIKLIKNNPGIIADLLEYQGYGSLEIKDHVNTYGGIVD